MCVRIQHNSTTLFLKRRKFIVKMKKNLCFQAVPDFTLLPQNKMTNFDKLLANKAHIGYRRRCARGNR